MSKDQISISDSSNISIPLRNLISMIAITGLSVWLYFGLTERLSMLEHEMEMLKIEVEENDSWIDEWENAGELPVDKIQNWRINNIEDILEMNIKDD